MKRLVILLLIVCPLMASAKTTLRTMLVEGKTWYYAYHHYNDEAGKYGDRTYSVSYTVRGDTLIDGREYRKMYRWDEVSRETLYYGAFREDEDGRVWQYDYAGDQKDFMICDITTYYYFEEADVAVEDVIDINGKLLKRYQRRGLIGLEGVGLQKYGIILYPLAPEPDCYCDYETFEYMVGDDFYFYTSSFKAPSYIQLTENEKRLVEQNNDFAFNLFRKARDGESKVLSPLSITYALGMLNNGAAGQTQQEINTVLGFDDVEAQNEFCLKITNGLLTAGYTDNTTKAILSNTIFVNKGRGYELQQDFTHTVNNYYYAYPQSRDFNDGETCGVINQWASDHTEGMIKGVLSENEFNPLAVSYLLNATYFKGMWSSPFETENTTDEPFAGGEKVPMMHRLIQTTYDENELYQTVSLPYGNGTYNMQVFLPREGKTLDEVIESLNGKNWQINGNNCEVGLSLPRFETDTDQDLVGVMSALGMPSAFNPYEADFSSMCVENILGENIYIGLMKQVAKIKLDEKGTEAAAVTIIGEFTTGIPDYAEFTANRPFFYIISEQSTGVILFMGQYMGNHPEGKEDPTKSIAINETNFPDDNLRNWVLSQEYGKDGVLTEEEIAGVTVIDVNGKNIANLQGIEKFTSLTSLYCSINELTTLDLSGCPQLNALDCSFNRQLASINLSGCKALQHLYCHGCKLTAIDLTDCTELIGLDCGTNLLTTIDPSPCNKMKSFVCSGNQLTTIDISACKALRSFDCQENQLTALDCSGLTELQTILCAMNALTSIKISGCSKLNGILCEFNNLGLDAFQHIMTNIPERGESDGAFMFVYSESHAEGSQDYTPDHNICSKEQVAIAKAKGWQVWCNTIGDSQLYEGVEVTPEIAYRPFVEDGKVWIVKVISNGWPKEEWIEYYYFDGDTIIDGQTAKRMMCVKGESLEFGVENIEAVENEKYIGAWYEQDKKVYYAGRNQEQFELFYDFTLSTGDSILMPNHETWLVEKVSGGIQGFKGTYYEIGDTERWLEGVGSETFPQANFRWNGNIGALIACCVGDEVIYLNEQLLEEQGIDDPDYAKKRRFDFNHTVKTQPKTPNRRGEEAALYGEYNEKSLDIRLDPLDDAYVVRITNQKTGETLYEKAINAGSIVALNIDISKYPEGQYEITIDNSNETFNGVIDTTTGIDEIVNGKSLNSKSIYNLNGQRIGPSKSSLKEDFISSPFKGDWRGSKGVYIVDGKKIFIK